MIKQNINQDVFVSMIRSKLPGDVLLQLEMLNRTKSKWTVENLRARLHEYITASEHAEKKMKQLAGDSMETMIHALIEVRSLLILVKEGINQVTRKQRAATIMLKIKF